MIAHSPTCTVAWTASVLSVNKIGSSDWWRSGEECAEGQFCSEEDTGYGHLTILYCLLSRLRTDSLLRQESATPRKHQDPVSGRRPLPEFQSTCFCCCSSDFSTYLCPASDGNQPGLPWHPHPVQDTDTAVYGVWCLDMDIKCCHPYEETRRSTKLWFEIVEDWRAPAAWSSHVTGTPAWRVSPSGLP